MGTCQMRCTPTSAAGSLVSVLHIAQLAQQLMHDSVSLHQSTTDDATI